MAVIPPWISVSPSEFGSAAHAGAQVGLAYDQMAQSAAQAQVAAQQHQQQLELESQRMAEEHLRAGQKLEFEKALNTAQLGLQRDQLDQAQQKITLAASVAARKFQAQQSYMNLIGQGVDPAKAMLMVGPSLGVSMTGLGQLAKEAQPFTPRVMEMGDGIKAVELGRNQWHMAPAPKATWGQDTIDINGRKVRVQRNSLTGEVKSVPGMNEHLSPQDMIAMTDARNEIKNFLKDWGGPAGAQMRKADPSGYSEALSMAHDAATKLLEIAPADPLARSVLGMGGGAAGAKSFHVPADGESSVAPKSASGLRILSIKQAGATPEPQAAPEQPAEPGSFHVPTDEETPPEQPSGFEPEASVASYWGGKVADRLRKTISPAYIPANLAIQAGKRIAKDVKQTFHGAGEVVDFEVDKAMRKHIVPAIEKAVKAIQPPAPEGKVHVMAPDGKTTGWIPENQLESAKSAGYKVIEDAQE